MAFELLNIVTRQKKRVHMIDRPGVAGAVLQTALLVINSLLLITH